LYVFDVLWVKICAGLGLKTVAAAVDHWVSMKTP